MSCGSKLTCLSVHVTIETDAIVYADQPRGDSGSTREANRIHPTQRSRCEDGKGEVKVRVSTSGERGGGVNE